MMSPASRGIRCISSRAVVDLPQPDSPTMPTVSPLAIENETSSTARTVLRAAEQVAAHREMLGQAVDLQQRLRRRRRDPRSAQACRSGVSVSLIDQFRMSMALRMPSLSRLKQIETAKIIAPGSAATHGLT